MYFLIDIFIFRKLFSVNTLPVEEHFVWYHTSFFYPFTFNLFVSLYLKVHLLQTAFSLAF